MDRFVRKLKKIKAQGDADYWKLCFIAEYALRKTPHGKRESVIIDFSKAMRCTSRNIYNMIGAAVTYRGLRKAFVKLSSNFPNRKYRELYQLPYSHFVRMGSLITRLDLSFLEALHYLFDALDLRYSADSMAMHIESDNRKEDDRQSDVQIDNNDGFVKMAESKALSLDNMSAQAPQEHIGQAIAIAADVIREAVQAIEEKEPAWVYQARNVKRATLALVDNKDLPDNLQSALFALVELLEQVLQEIV